MRDFYAGHFDIYNSLRLKRNALLKFERQDSTFGQLSTGDLDSLSDALVSNNVVKYYVDSNKGASGWPGSREKPVTTIDAAINLCTDTTKVYEIHVAELHSEAITTASAIDVDVNNVAIIGHGRGDKQAKVTFGNAVATLEVNADNALITGMHFQATVTSVATGIDIKDGADDYMIVGNRFTAATLGTDEFLDSVSVTTSDRGIIAGNYVDMDEAGAQSAFHLVGACLGCNIYDNYVVGDYAVGCVEGITAAAEQVLIENNTLVNGVHSGLNTVACISLFTGTTGFIQRNNIYTNVATPNLAVVADACFLSDNWYCEAVGSPAEPIYASAGVNGLGTKVSKTNGDPTAATDALFTVTGKNLVTLLHGEVTTTLAGSMGAVTTTLQTTTNNRALCGASTITGDTAGTLYILTGDTDAALNGGAAPSDDVTSNTTGVFAPVIVDGDGIEMATSAATTMPTAGVIQWDLFYLPLEAGAIIAAAA